jgi:predicted secreted Zn-dependent protease
VPAPPHLPLLLALLFAAAPAAAEPEIRVRVEEYPVSGRNGAAVMDQIRRKGPEHGAGGRTIAQTRYTLDYGYEGRWRNGRCRPDSPWVRLELTFVYPRLEGAAPPELRSAWEVFLDGARAHEQGHADLAIEMARAAETALRSASFPSGQDCAGLRAAIDREIRRIFEAHEARQRRYDRREHRHGGPVDRIVDALQGDAIRAWQPPQR